MEVEVRTVLDCLRSMGEGLLVRARRVPGMQKTHVGHLQELLHALANVIPVDDALKEMVLAKMHLNIEIDKIERYWEQRAWTTWF